MTWFRLARGCAAGILLILGMTGCFPSGDSPLDEQKEPHFLTGKSLATQMDYQGAIDSFEKALEVNPRSASAHFELAWLYENKAQIPDPAAAIYHYDRFLKLCPKSDKADLARAHINSCKLDLVKTVSSFAVLPPTAQHDMENLLLENKNLKAQLTQYQSAPANRPQPVVVAPTPVAPQPVSAPTHVEAIRPAASNITLAYAGRTSTPAASRTHVVKSGEFPSTIARQYGISVASLMAANPQAKATHLQVGQTLNIPAP
jgi:LysM repeat protein